MADNYVTVEGLTKTYGEKTLFRNLSFGINKGQKTALVAANGSGKSTLMKILAGKETCDEGTLSFRKDIRVSYLEQHPLQGVNASIMDVLFDSDTPLMQAVKRYEQALYAVRTDDCPATQRQLTDAISEMDSLNAWNYESEIKEMLGRLNITDLQQNVGTLSGGERKKVALCTVLISQSEVLLLDEPTNHLDIKMIEWLEAYLGTSNQSLLIVSHDRYFINNVCTDIYELGEEGMDKYRGNFEYYLEKKDEKRRQQESEQAKARNLYKKELEWIRRMPQARGTKSRSRIEAFEQLQESLVRKTEEENRDFSVKSRRIGGKILEISNIAKSYDGKVLIRDFSHIYKRRQDRRGGNQRVWKDYLFRNHNRQIEARQRQGKHGTNHKDRLLYPEYSARKSRNKGYRRNQTFFRQHPTIRRHTIECFPISKLFRHTSAETVHGLCSFVGRREKIA